MPPVKLSRRRFLQLSGVAGGGLVVASVAGVSVWNSIDALPAPTSPYVVPDAVEDGDALILALYSPDAPNPFGAYLGEILRTEGIPAFTLMDWDEVGSRALDAFGVILLAEGPLSREQAERLSAYVFQGGQLIAFRPAAQLVQALGLERLSGEVSEGYLQVDPGHPLAGGVETRAMQFHGAADYYRPAGAEVIAWLAGADDRPTDYPAVTIYAYGEGRAVCWSFDLAKSAALTRQGNPAWVNQERDGRLGIRAVDAFVGWMDLDRLAIPHVDEQMRLLGRLITEMLLPRLPLPRLGYFPDGQRGVLVVTGDSHQNVPPIIEQTLSLVERYGGHMSVYHTPPTASKLRRILQRGRAELAGVPVISSVVAHDLRYPTPAQVAEWRRRGHEFGLHPYVEEGLEVGWEEYQKSFVSFGYGPVPPTVRTHRILWDGWVETARVQASYGIRMNLDYYHYGTAFQKESGEWVYGLFNGSGLPMKFVDEQGRILNIYQQVTQLVDEHLMKVPWGGGWAGLNGDQAVQVAEQDLQHAATVGAALSVQFHVDPLAFEEEYVNNATRFMEGTLAAAAGLGFPIWSAEAWYAFTEARQQARMSAWSADAAGRRLSFTLETAEAGEATLQVMLPQAWLGAQLEQVWVDDAQVQVSARSFAGMDYGSFTMPLGKRQVAAQYRGNA